jgi:hypothetical protein
LSIEDALAALRALLRPSHLAGADDVPGLVTGAGARLGAVASRLYLVDYDQILLVPFVGTTAQADERIGAVKIDGTLAGRAYSEVSQQLGAAARGATLWCPVLDGTDRVGVLQLEFPATVELDDELRGACADVAGLLAELVLTRSLYGDVIERTRRRLGMTIPAEIQWTQLPPLTFVSARVAIAGVLAPTAEVAGDSFDYALNGDTAQVAILDAMGHGMEATLMSAVAVAALRNSRRGGADLADTVRVMDDEIAKQFGADKFVTAIVGELDLATGWWRWVNCGHPPALLVRNGQVVKVLSEVAALPLGLGLLGDEPAVGEERLQPADRIVLYTDGVVEARDAFGDFFGVDRLVDFVGRHASAGRPVAETLRRLNHAVLGYQAGVLQDDATTVLIEWRPAQPEASIP